MAESTNKSPATTSAAGGIPSNPEAGAAGPVSVNGLAGGASLNAEDFLDSIMEPAPGDAPNGEESQGTTDSEGEEQVQGQGQDQTQGQDQESKGKGDATEGDEAEEQEQETATGAAESATTGKPQLGQFEQGVLKTLRESKVPEALQKRIAKSFEKEIKNRDALTKRDEIIATKDQELEQLRTQMQESALAVTQAPAGPLAHLDTPEKVEKTRQDVTHNLQWAKKADADSLAKHFPDDGEDVPESRRLTGQEKFERWKEEQYSYLELLPVQAQIVTTRAESRKKLQQAMPDLVKPGSEDAKALASFYGTDVRARTDSDEVFRLYMKARKMEAEEARGVRYHRIDPTATAKKPGANGNGNGHINGHGGDAEGGPESNGRKSSISLPAPRTAARVPVRSQGPDPRTEVQKQLQNGQSVDAESWAEAQGAN